MASAPIDVAPFSRVRGERPLYTSAAMVAAVVVLAGLAPSYYLKSFFGASDLTTLKHVHGVVMTAWLVLFFVKSRSSPEPHPKRPTSTEVGRLHLWR